MYNVSSTFLEKVKQNNRTVRGKLDIGTANLVYEDIIDMSMEFSLGNDNIPAIGGVVASKLTVKLLKDNLPSILTTQELKPYLGLEISPDVFEYVPMGVFRVSPQDIQKTDKTVTLTGYDDLFILGNSPYNTNLTFPNTWNNIKAELATKGLKFKVQSLSNVSIKEKPNNIRELLSDVAELLGMNVVSNRLGELEFRKLSTTTFATDNYNTFRLLADDDVKLTRITVEKEENNLTFGNDTGFTIKIKNDSITTESELITVYNRVFPLSYTAYECGLHGQPHLDVGDIIKLTDKNGVVRNIPIAYHKIDYSGGLRSEIRANAPKGAISSTGSTGSNSITQSLNNLRINLLEVNAVLADKISVAQFEALQAIIEDLDVEDLTAIKAYITELQVLDLDAAVAEIGTLKSTLGEIGTLLSGNLTADNLQAGLITATSGLIANLAITNAMIKNMNADKINAGKINTKLVEVGSEDGKFIIADNTLQINDGTKVRVQIGKDATGDYSLSLWDVAGKLLFDARGLTEDAIKDEIIRNDMIASDANISGDKIDIGSVVRSINEGVTKLESSAILYDGKSLSVAFNELETNMDNMDTPTYEEVIFKGTINSVPQNILPSKVSPIIYGQTNGNGESAVINSIRSVGKNSFYEPKYIDEFNPSGQSGNMATLSYDGEKLTVTGRVGQYASIRSKDLKLKLNTNYRLILDGNASVGTIGRVDLWGIKAGIRTLITPYVTLPAIRGVVSALINSGNYDTWHIQYYATANTSTTTDMYVYSTMLVEEGVATAYEPYTESTQYLPNAGELRSVPSAKDEIRMRGGKAEKVQRVGRNIVSGVDAWQNHLTRADYYYFRLPTWASTVGFVSSGTIPLGSLMAFNGDTPYVITENSSSVSDRREIITLNDTLYVAIEKTKVDSRAGATTLDKFKTYLNQYPITLVYQLLQEVVVPIDTTSLEIFEGGTVYVGSPVIPEIKFDGATNLAGQVELNKQGTNADIETRVKVTDFTIEQGKIATLISDVYTETTGGEPNFAKTKVSELKQTVEGFTTTVSELTTTVGEKSSDWFYAVPPTLLNVPYTTWATTEVRDKHINDVYTDTLTGYVYRFIKTGSVYSWAKLTDKDLTDARTRLGTAEGKITTTDSKLSTLEQNVDGFKAIVSATYSSKTEVDSKILADKTIKDTRNDNQPPTWYWTNYKIQTVKEFKFRSIVGAPGGTNYGVLITEVPWSDGSGGSIIQTFESVNGTYERRSTGLETWSNWETIATQSSVTLEISTAKQTIIEQTNASIALKANATDVYTKTAADGATDTKIATARGAITVETNAIALSVADTQISKVVFGGRNYFSLDKIKTAPEVYYWPEHPTIATKVLAFVFESNTDVTVTTNIPVTGNTVYFNGNLTANNVRVGTTPQTRKTDANGLIYIAILPSRSQYAQIMNGTYWVKLEKGNKATDWTPAPEDVDAKISGQETRLASAELKILPATIKATVESQIAESGSLVLAKKSDLTLTEDALTLKFNTSRGLQAFRYIKVSLKGSIESAYSYWGELEVYAGGVNIALGKTVTSDFTPSVGALTNYTDGNKAINVASSTGSSAWKALTVDLGSVRSDVDSLVEYKNSASRQYHQKIQVSIDNINWYDIYNSEIQGVFVSNYTTGKTFFINGGASSGITQITKDGVKVSHTGLGSQYSEIRADGFFRNWGNGTEGAYLNDIHVVTNLASDTRHSTSTPTLIELPTRFQNRVIKALAIPRRFDSSVVGTDSSGTITQYLRHFEFVLDVIGIITDATIPYVVINAWLEIGTRSRGDSWALDYAYLDIDFDLIVIGY